MSCFKFECWCSDHFWQFCLWFHFSCIFLSLPWILIQLVAFIRIYHFRLYQLQRLFVLQLVRRNRLSVNFAFCKLNLLLFVTMRNVEDADYWCSFLELIFWVSSSEDYNFLRYFIVNRRGHWNSREEISDDVNVVYLFVLDVQAEAVRCWQATFWDEWNWSQFAVIAFWHIRRIVIHISIAQVITVALLLVFVIEHVSVNNHDEAVVTFVIFIWQFNRLKLKGRKSALGSWPANDEHEMIDNYSSVSKSRNNVSFIINVNHVPCSIQKVEDPNVIQKMVIYWIYSTMNDHLIFVNNSWMLVAWLWLDGGTVNKPFIAFNWIQINVKKYVFRILWIQSTEKNNVLIIIVTTSMINSSFFSKINFFCS